MGQPPPGANRRVTTSDGLELAVRERGDLQGPVILALHGYPDNQTLWDGVVAELAARFRVVTYDVRGTGASDTPRSRAAYRLDRLTDDLGAVLREVSPDRAVHLLAHDWGSVQAWHAVTDPQWPGQVASYTSISGPCLEQIGDWVRIRLRHPRPKALREVITQFVLSGYIAFFQIPRLPELAWSSGVLTRLVGLVGRATGARPDLDDARNGVQLYRANMLPAAHRPHARPATVPVQVLAPTGDPFVSDSLQTDVGAWAPDLRVRRLTGGHWLPCTHPGAVARHTAELVDEVEWRRRTGIEPA